MFTKKIGNLIFETLFVALFWRDATSFHTVHWSIIQNKWAKNISQIIDKLSYSDQIWTQIFCKVRNVIFWVIISTEFAAQIWFF